MSNQPNQHEFNSVSKNSDTKRNHHNNKDSKHNQHQPTKIHNQSPTTPASNIAETIISSKGALNSSQAFAKSKTIISLSKLKNYMPHSQGAANQLLNLRQNSADSIAPIQGVFSKVNYPFATNLDNVSGCDASPFQHANQQIYQGEKVARAKSLGLNPPNPPVSLGGTSGRNPSSQSLVSGYHLHSLLKPSIGATESKDHYRDQQALVARRNSIPESISAKLADNTIQVCTNLLEGVEPIQNKPDRGDTDHSDVAKEDRKRKRSNYTTQTNSNENRDRDTSSNSSKADTSEHKPIRTTSIADNMTPSSLLPTQNHGYVEQHQLQHCTSNNNNDSNYRTSTDIQHQGKENDNMNVDQMPQINAKIAAIVDDQNRQANGCASQAALSTSSSSSLMLTSVNQFKTASDSSNNSNSSTSKTNIHTPTTARANDLNASDYSNSNHSTTQTTTSANQQQLTDALANVDSFQQSYQHISNNYELKSSNGSQSFVQYGAAASNRIVSSANYPNLPASILGQQMKFEGSMSNGTHFSDHDRGGSLIIDHNNSIAGHSSVGSLVAAKAQQQARTHFNQYYQNHYNFMPTPSSKSSSPTSSSSTPPPKSSSAMHANTSQITNQQQQQQHQQQQQQQQQQHHISNLATTTNSSSSVQNHLDQLSNHYMNGGTSGISQHQNHHLGQQYGYTHQCMVTTNNAHTNSSSNISNHDQNYDHHQQHQHHHNHQQHVGQNQQQSLYHHLTNNSSNVGINHIYGNTRVASSYQAGHLANGVTGGGHQTNHQLVSGAHQGNVNSAAAHAAAVVSQTLKTVANQHTQYGAVMTNGFGPPTGTIMNMSSQHHHHHHHHHEALGGAVNSLNHHLNNQSACLQQPQHHQNLPSNHPTSVATRKYQCKMCPQVFMSKAEMKYHNQNHMREAKPYKCLQCPKAFANSSYLSQHMRIHQGVKPYSCDICSRKFTQLSHLQQHKRTHTGDKPYKCNYLNCTKQFSQLSNLQSHSRCHQLDKPYKCNSCYKCFHDEQSLLEHIPRHLESKHLKKNLCIFCGSSYQQERGLVKHFQQYHTDKSPTLVAAAIAAGTTGNTNLIASLISTRPSNVFSAPSNGAVSSANCITNFNGSNSQLSSGNIVHSNAHNLHEVAAGRYNMFG